MVTAWIVAQYKETALLIRTYAVRARDLARDLKNRLRINTSFLAAKRRGDIRTRIEGLGRLFEAADGATVLDLGCFDGLIAYEFFRAGAQLVHGVDNDAYHLDTANRIFSQVSIPYRFAHADLRSPDAIEAALGDACIDRYDIVLFLGVFQHIYKSMPVQQRKAVVDGVLGRVGSLLAVRVPENVWQEFESLMPEKQLEIIHRVAQQGNVGELRVYRRNSRADAAR